jgi:hypothetical protein
MKIAQSNVSLFSSHQKSSEITEQESLEKWSTFQEAPERFKNRDRRDRVELTDKFKSSEVQDNTENSGLDPKLMSIIRAIEALTGKKMDLSFLQRRASTEKSNQPTLQGWGINYSYEKNEIHEESLKFSAKGNVQSEDGRSIDFSLAFSMQSHTEIHESISFKAGDAAIDPLVLNFGTDVVSISDMKHNFDLNLDGKKEEFSFVGSGSGFLALDKNRDGIINDGSELFGPTKGNGFEELSAYDSDHNNWIDENDSIFNSLVIWTKDESGKENLYSLKDKNVGALYLGNANTQFDLKDSTQNLQAFMKESSIYLKEDGGVGTLQEVDLVV